MQKYREWMNVGKKKKKKTTKRKKGEEVEYKK
jgi:hypothetical protein